MMDIINSEQKTLLGIYDEDLKRLETRIGKDRALNTFATMQLGKGYVTAYLKDKMGMTDIPLQMLTPSFISDFSVYLSADRGLRGGTVWLACQQLKGVVTRAHLRGILLLNPFAGFRIAKKIRPREYLTEEELKELLSHEFKQESLRFAQDIFLFAAFTGLSYIDICELRPSDIMEIGDSKWIVSKRHKTLIPYQMKLLGIPLQILQRYQQKGNDKVFGKIVYRTVAKNIKKVMTEIGINKHITMHCARHSFAVLAISKGMPIESVSRILGHTNISTTQIYAKITLQKLNSDILEFEKHLNPAFLL